MRAFYSSGRLIASRSTLFSNTQATRSKVSARLLSTSRQCNSHGTRPKFPWQQNSGFLFRNYRSTMLRRLRESRRHNSNSRPSPDPTANLGSPEGQLTLSQRMKKLSREYGWSALGVYLALSALDFPFCFLAVRVIGTERIGEAEHAIVNAFWRVVSMVYPDANKHEPVTPDGQKALPRPGESEVEPEKWSWGVEEAQEQAGKSNATLYTQLVLAYAIHKSFIFVRVPLTAAVTPKVVKTLRGWGWNIGKRPIKPTTSPPSSKP